MGMASEVSTREQQLMPVIEFSLVYWEDYLSSRSDELSLS